MFQELSGGASERSLAEENQLGQTLGFDGPYPALCKGVQIGTASRQQEWLYAAGTERGSERRAEFRVAIMQYKANRPKNTVNFVRGIAAIYTIHCSVGCGVMPTKVTRRVSRWRKNRT